RVEADRALRVRSRPPPEAQARRRHPQGEHHEALRRPLPRLRARDREAPPGNFIRRADRRQRVHAARPPPTGVRRPAAREPLRRHRVGPVRRARRGPRARAGRERRRPLRDLRSGARDRAGHRGQERSEPARRDPHRRDDAAVHRPAEARRPRRARGPPAAARAPDADARPRRPGDNERRHRAADRAPLTPAARERAGRPRWPNPWWIPPFLGRVPAIEPHLVRLLGLVALALFFEQYDQSMLTSALKYIATDLGMTESELGGYLGLIRLGALPAFLVVPFADRIGRRRVFLLSVLGISVGTCLTAFTRTAAEFVAAQMATRTFVLTGAAAAFVIVTE